MVKYYESTSVFHFSWDQVAQGFWKRYPNPHRYVHHLKFRNYGLFSA